MENTSCSKCGGTNYENIRFESQLRTKDGRVIGTDAVRCIGCGHLDFFDNPEKLHDE